jgi:hypothetical protein
VISALTYLILLGLPLLQVSGNTVIKMTIRYGQADNSSQQTIYISGDRKRMEFRNSEGVKQADGSTKSLYGPRLVAITRCDLGQGFELNLDASEYTAVPYPPKPLTKEQIEACGLQIPATYRSQKPTLRIEVTTTDTGERKETFGHTARHVITTRKQMPLEGSQSDPQESVTDAWYVDLNPRLSCDRNWPKGKGTHAYLRAVNGKQSNEKAEFVSTGEPETGFALHSLTTSKITYKLPDGTRKQAETQHEVLVTELGERPLDPALFEIPSGFKRVERIQRNPTLSASSVQSVSFWQRFKADLARFFNR